MVNVLTLIFTTHTWQAMVLQLAVVLGAVSWVYAIYSGIRRYTR